MNLFQRLKESWQQPFFFYGNSSLSLAEGAFITASAMVLIGFWILGFFGYGSFPTPMSASSWTFVCPDSFCPGLLLILIVLGLRQRRLKAEGQIPLNLS